MGTLTGLLKSKTFWFNVGTGLLALLQQTLTDGGIDPVYLSSFVALGNVGLRAVTTKPLAEK